MKIWDLRQGHILYTLYGHEGSSTSASFSPCGDYFTTGGGDSVVMVWKSNMDENEQEFIEDFGAKSSPADAGVVPVASQKRPQTAKRQGTARSNKRGPSPQKSTYGQTSRIGGDMNYDHYVAPAGEGDSNAQGGSGEELA